MKVNIAKLPKSEAELKIEVPVQEWQEFLDGAAKELSRDLKIEGFRPGYAPLKLVEEKIGTAKILEEAARHCVQKCYVRAVMEQGIEAIGQPEVSILKMAKGNPFEFKAKVSIMPEIKLPDYKKIASEVKRNKVLVEDREIEEALSWIRKSRAKFSQKSGPCQKGNWIEIKLKINPSAGGEKLKIPESEIKDGFILGEGKLIPGLEEKIEGMSAGEEKISPLSFPENHFQKDLAGKKADFEIKLESVQKMEFPEINDGFAQGLGNFKNIAELKNSLKEGICLEKEAAESQRVRQKILGKITENSELEIPEILVDETKSQMLEELKQSVFQNLGITFEDYLVRAKKTEKELLDSFSLEAEKRVRKSLVLKEISKKEKIEVSNEETEAEANKIFKNYPDTKEFDFTKLKDYTKEVMINEKTFRFLESFTA